MAEVPDIQTPLKVASS